jgi:hypothetical protein
MSRERAAILVGTLCAMLGVGLRLLAHRLAESTVLGRAVSTAETRAADDAAAERALSDVAVMLLAFGMALVLLAAHAWLRGGQARSQGNPGR